MANGASAMTAEDLYFNNEVAGPVREKFACPL
jgi:hypothetical protein